MTDVKEQRICIKFCCELGKIAAETHKMLKKTSAQGRMQPYEWFKRFKHRRMSVDGEERTQQPSTGTRTKNAAQVQEAIMEDQWRTIHDIRNIIGLSYGIRQQILSDELNIRRTAAKFVLRLLSSEYRLAVWTEPKEEAENNPNYISTIITGDESWVFGYDPETKQ